MLVLFVHGTCVCVDIPPFSVRGEKYVELQHDLMDSLYMISKKQQQQNVF